MEISPGDSVVFSLKVENRGDGEDTLEARIENEDDLVDNGWTLAPIQKLIIDEKQVKPISYTVQAPQKWTIWQNKIHIIKLEMVSTDGGVKEPYPLFVRTKGVYIPGFEPVFAIMALLGMAFIMKRHRNKR